MKIYFVRHGESEANKQGVLTGHLDVVLTSEGIAQAKKTALEIPLDFSEILSSDLIRCKQTAEILNEKLRVPISYDARLRERDFGSLQGKSWTDIDPAIRSLDLIQQYDYRAFGGESVEEVKKRLLQCIDDMRAIKAGAKILVVTSAGIIRLLHNMLNGKVHEKIHNSSLHEFEF